MQAVWMSENKDALFHVYPADLREEMAQHFSFLPQIFTMKESEEEKMLLSHVEVIFSTWGMPKLSETEIHTYLPSLRAVFYGAGSVQYFVRPFLACGAAVFSAWAANAVPVAEVTAAQIILANKGYYQRLQYEGGIWENKTMRHAVPGNYNANVGIIGAGMIGKLVIQMLHAYDLHLFVFDPFLSDEQAVELGVTKVDTLPQLFMRCHVISNHLANNPQTVGMIGKACFDAMLPNAVFINTGRGAQVDETALIAAMQAEPERIALLDVTDPEPPAPESAMYHMRNILLTPHIAGSIGQEVQRMGRYMFEEACRWANGEETRWRVMETMLATMA